MAQDQFDGMKAETLRLMQPYFEQYLVPSKIVPLLNTILKDEKREQILNTEKYSRKDAVKELIEVILNNEEHGISLFIFVLQGEGSSMPRWDRFLKPLENKRENGLNRMANEYYAFILHLLEGSIIAELTEGEIYEIILHFYGAEIIDESDMEEITVILNQKGRYYGALQMFTAMKHHTTDWPQEFFQALKSAKPELLCKIDPLNESPLMEEEFKKEERVVGTMSHRSQKPRISSKESGMVGCVNDDDDTFPKQNWTVSEGACDTSPQRAESIGEGSSDDAGDFSDYEEKHAREESEKTQKKLGTGAENTQERRELVPVLQQRDGVRGRDPLHMRNYQKELAAPAVEGRNVIICAPTGSGKTRVALFIVRHHLQTAHGQKRKVAFLARTVPLVTQQYKIFVKYLPDFKSVLVTGDSDLSMQLHHLLHDYDILVLTPKVLENHLVPEKIPSLTAFSLLVFDECHHTRKGEPYNSLMKSYLKSKNKEPIGLPQIVGLTASIGVEKATTVSEAAESVLGIMGNLDVLKISTVKENLEELQNTVPKPEEGRSERLMSRDGDEISSKLLEIMTETEDILNRIGGKLLDEDIMKTLDKRPGDRKDQKYGQWAVKLRNQARLLKIPETVEDDFYSEVNKHKEYTRKIQVYADCLAAYNDALEVHDLMRPQDVLEFLERKFQQHTLHARDQHTTNKERQILTLFQDLKRLIGTLDDENPNLITLANTILENVSMEDGNGSQIIIFVRTRATCLALCKWLNSHSSLKKLNATQFTGTGARQDEGGMTQNEQEGVIEKFRSGEVKVLVSTSVGEEGIDIPDCNLVIKYNQVGNEVTTVQTRGRSRKEGGRSILIAKDKIMQQEMINRCRAEMMYKAIDMVNAMSPKDVAERVRKVQKKTLEDESIKEIVRAVKRQLKAKKSFSLVCGRCKSVRVPGDSIRTINSAHHVVIGQQLKQQVICRRNPTRRIDDVDFTGSLVCGKPGCGNGLGQMLNYMSIPFMTLGIKQWIVEDEDGNPASYKSWSKVPFHVEPIRPDDVRRHLDSDTRQDSESDDDSDD